MAEQVYMNKKNKCMMIRLTPEMRQRLIRASDDEATPISQIVRRAIARELKRIDRGIVEDRTRDALL